MRTIRDVGDWGDTGDYAGMQNYGDMMNRRIMANMENAGRGCKFAGVGGRVWSRMLGCWYRFAVHCLGEAGWSLAVGCGSSNSDKI